MRGCQSASGIVADVRDEEDGDLHVIVRLDGYKFLTNSVNNSQQGGNLVVELMGRDGGHLPAPSIGEHIIVTGAWVTDTEHGWNEIHPVWKETLLGRSYLSGAWAGGSPSWARSSNAEGLCRTSHGGPCLGYGTLPAFSPSHPTHAPMAPHSSSSSSKCDPNYTGACIPPYPPDHNCSDPGIPTNFRSVGSDPDGFDGDGDGIACEG